MEKKRITIKDVAEKSGYSIATVSKALNGVDVVKPETKRAIQEVADQLNYIPNLMGQQLKTGKTKMIGIYTNRIGGSYFNELINGAINVLQPQGFGINILVSENRETILSHLFGNVVDGAIIIEEVLQKKDIELIKSKGIPVVFINKVVYSKMVGSVVFDSFDKGFFVGNYLMQQGHRKIGYIRGQEEIYDNTERFAGLVQSLTRKKITYDERYTIIGNFVESDSYQNTKVFLAEQGTDLPTALVAANDESAIGAMKAIQEYGLNIPADISIIGFDDIDLLQYIHPQLTTIRNAASDQGYEAATLLLNLIIGEATGEIIEVKGELIIRETVREIGV